MLSVFRATFTTMIVLLSLIVVKTNHAFAQSERNYAYLVITADNQNDILIINANNPSASAARKNFPIAEGWALNRQIFLSPDGQWIAAVIGTVDQYTLTIQIYNMVSGESREIIQGIIMSPDGQNIAWSPDGRYLALNIAQEPGSLNTFLYSVADGKLTNLTSDNIDHYDIGWSSDSMHLATFTKICSDKGTDCKGNVELFDLVKGAHDVSPDLPSSFGLAIACNFVISPKAQLVAFVLHCASQPEVTTDVYLWDVAAKTVTQATDLFAAETPLHATYQLAWLDTQKLLVGVDYQPYNQPEKYQLASYDVQSQLLETISTAAGTSFALSPTLDHIAIQLHGTVADAAVAGNNDRVVISSTASLTNPSSLNAAAVTGDNGVPSGCGLRWSANGILSYSTYAEAGCHGDLTGFVFINDTSKVLGIHSITSDGVPANSVILPLGWIAG